MIRSFFFLSAMLLLLQLGLAQVSVYKTEALPVFDGDTTDAVWQDQSWQSIGSVWIPYNNILPSAYTTESGTQTLTGASDFSGRFKMVWHAETNTLVFVVEITDDVFIDGYVYPNSGYSNFDVLEVFIDEDKSGDNHLFDASGNNAENAFAYHMMVAKPSVGGVTTQMLAACDIAGTSWGNYTITDYKSHFTNFSMKNHGNGRYVWEFALKTYNSTYNGSNAATTQTNLVGNKLLGLSVAYCDNDQTDNLRDSFIGSVSVTGAQNNDSYLDASIFGSYRLDVFGSSNYLSVSPNTIQAMASTTGIVLTITSNTSYTLQTAAQNAWIQIPMGTQTINGVLNLPIQSNTDTTSRLAVITLTSGIRAYQVQVLQFGTTTSSITPPNTLGGTNTITGQNTLAGIPTLTGITNHAQSASVTIYPNPANQVLHLETLSAIGMVQIYQTTGNLIYETSTLQTTLEITLEGLSDGIYLLSLPDQHKTIRFMKLAP